MARGGAGHASRRHAGRARPNSFNPSTEPVSGSTACSGCGISPTHVARRVAHAGDVARRAVEAVAGRVAQHDLAVRLQLVEHGVGRPVAARRVLGRDGEPVARRARARPRRAALTTSSSTWRQTKRSDVFGSSAPGSSAGLAQHLEAVADAEHRARRGGRSGRPPPSPARSARSRRRAGSRRRRSRRGRSPRRRPAGRGRGARGSRPPPRGAPACSASTVVAGAREPDDAELHAAPWIS